ncbi:MAG: M56 family metallopeptidase [Desulfitobacteriaceae bacterium]
MLDHVFYFVLNMSITAALIIMVLLIIRMSFGRWIPKSVVYSLWGIVLFRLLVPVAIPSEVSMLNLFSGFLTRTVAVPKGFERMPDFSTLNSIQAANAYFPLEYKSDILRIIFTVSGYVWIAGAVILSIALLVMYNLTVAHLRKAELIKDSVVLEMCRSRLKVKSEVRLFASDCVASPIVVGIINPRIIIPQDMDEQTLEYALRHELAHIKRRDNLWKMIALFAVCIHWFNPLVWLSLYIADRDMELACDAKVLKDLAGEERKLYAEALVSLAAKQRFAHTSFGGTAIKRRIINIVNYQRVSLFMVVITAVICLALVLLLLTNPIL